jgi:hypothetical protein
MTECINVESNVCEQGNLSLVEIMAEINKLKQENEQLTSEKDYWKRNYIELHNKITNEEYIGLETQNQHNEGGYTDQEFDELAKAYADFGY